MARMIRNNYWRRVGMSNARNLATMSSSNRGKSIGDFGAQRRCKALIEKHLRKIRVARRASR